MRPGILIPAAIALAVIWSGVALVMSMTEDSISSPEKVYDIVREAPWKNGKKPSPAERRTYLDRLARFYTMLDQDQRKTMRDEDSTGEMALFMLDLTPDERKHYLSVIVEAQVQLEQVAMVRRDSTAQRLGQARRRPDLARQRQEPVLQPAQHSASASRHSRRCASPSPGARLCPGSDKP